MFHGSNPQAREGAEILNELLSIRRTTERVEGLKWLLGRREYYAADSLEPGSHGVTYDQSTQTLYLFNIPVLRVDTARHAELVKPALRMSTSTDKGETK